MIQQLMALLPREINTIAILIGIVGAFLGGVLWLGGSRFSRTLITLISVSTGALVGLNLPGWFGWRLEGWATAVLGALVLGISGFVLHKLWVGIGLGLILVVWAALGTFALAQEQAVEQPTLVLKAEQGAPAVITQAQPWAWPAITQETTPRTYAVAVWESLSDSIRRVLPLACGAALVGGLVISMLWPRIGVVLLYSCAGITLLVGMGVAVLMGAKPQWLSVIPSKTPSQLMLLGAMVAFGAIVQWRSIPRKPYVASAPARD